MSLRIDSTEWISGALIIGNTGFGVVGSDIPSSGDSGAAYCYNDLTLPADNGKEICGRITTWPTAGALTAYEDTSFEFTGPGGSYSFQYQLYVDGVATGSPTNVTLVVASGTITTTSGAIAVSDSSDMVAIAGARTVGATISTGDSIDLSDIECVATVGATIATTDSSDISSGFYYQIQNIGMFGIGPLNG